MSKVKVKQQQPNHKFKLMGQRSHPGTNTGLKPNHSHMPNPLLQVSHCLGLSPPPCASEVGEVASGFSANVEKTNANKPLARCAHVGRPCCYEVEFLLKASG